MNLLVRATNWIGDAVLSLPALRALRAAHPEARITVLAKPWVAGLYEGESCVDEIIDLNDNLRAHRFDAALLLPNSFRSALQIRLAGIPRRIGYARDGRSFLLTRAIPVPKPGETPPHQCYYYLELLRRAGWIDRFPDTLDVTLESREKLRIKGAGLFAQLGIQLPVLGLSPGAAFGTAKCWLPERFAEAARALSPGSVAVFGSAAESELCALVAQASGGVNLAGRTTLPEFIALTAACSQFLANDSGAMHIAAAVATPCVTVFGPTDETATGPVGPTARIVRHPVPCAPCHLRECRYDHHNCMALVTAEDVVRAAR